MTGARREGSPTRNISWSNTAPIGRHQIIPPTPVTRLNGGGQNTTAAAAAPPPQISDQNNAATNPFGGPPCQSSTDEEDDLLLQPKFQLQTSQLHSDAMAPSHLSAGLSKTSASAIKKSIDKGKMVNLAYIKEAVGEYWDSEEFAPHKERYADLNPYNRTRYIQLLDKAISAKLCRCQRAGRATQGRQA